MHGNISYQESICEIHCSLSNYFFQMNTDYELFQS